MAFRALRVALYSALAIFSVILLGMTSSRIRHTNTAPGSIHFYDSIVVELLVTSILALLFSLFLIFGICLAIGGALSFLTELIGLGILWIMFLVGAAIVTHHYRNLNYCRGYSLQCRLLFGVISWSWICFAITTFLVLASLAAVILGKHGIRSAVHGSGTRERRHRGRNAAAVGAAAGTGLAAEHHHEHKNATNAAAADTTSPGYNQYNTANPATTTDNQAGYNTTQGTGYNTAQGAGYNGDYEKGTNYITGTPGYGSDVPGYREGNAYESGSGPYGGQTQMGQTGYSDPVSTGNTGMTGTGQGSRLGGEYDDYAQQKV